MERAIWAPYATAVILRRNFSTLRRWRFCGGRRRQLGLEHRQWKELGKFSSPQFKGRWENSSSSNTTSTWKQEVRLNSKYLLPRFATMEEQYEKAIEALNNLQTNHSVLEQVKKERRKQVHLNLTRAATLLEKTGMSMADLDAMKIIHVAGTKGKGSTCAFCESILRHRGLKTGLFTSPHLLSVTERIRINGTPIDKEKFAYYFWQVYDKVITDNPAEYRPPYFKFLTTLAFNIFWREKVDVAIIEGKTMSTFPFVNCHPTSHH